MAGHIYLHIIRKAGEREGDKWKILAVYLADKDHAKVILSVSVLMRHAYYIIEGVDQRVKRAIKVSREIN